jgi:hypothetical protein
MTTTATRSTTMVRHRRSTDSLNSYLAFSTHSFVNMLVTNRTMARHAFTICHAYLTRSLWARIHHAWGTMHRRSNRLGADGALMHYTLERSDARHPEGTPSSSGVLMKLASRGTNTRPTLSLLLHETKLQEGGGAQGRGVVKLLDILNGEDRGRTACRRWWRGWRGVWIYIFMGAGGRRGGHRWGSARRWGQVPRSRQGILMVEAQPYTLLSITSVVPAIHEL